MQPEGRPLVVAAQLEPAEAGGRLAVLVAVLTDVLDGAAQFTDLGDGGVQVVDAEEQVGEASLSPPCRPPGTPPVLMAKPRPLGPGSRVQPKRAW